MIGWIKCNTNGVVTGSPGSSTSGRIFRDSNADFIGCFAKKLPS
jgi:hypothetical protein